MEVFSDRGREFHTHLRLKMLTLLCAQARKVFTLGLMAQSPCDEKAGHSRRGLISSLKFALRGKSWSGAQENRIGCVDDAIGGRLGWLSHDCCRYCRCALSDSVKSSCLFRVKVEKLGCSSARMQTSELLLLRDLSKEEKNAESHSVESFDQCGVALEYPNRLVCLIIIVD